MHFTYLQDDVRVNDHLTANLDCVTARHAAVGSEQRCRTTIRRMADDHREGRLAHRPHAGEPRSQQLRASARLRTPMIKTAIRGGYGISYVHVNRTGARGSSFDQRPAGHQRRGQSRKPVLNDPTFRQRNRDIRPASRIRRNSTRSRRTSASFRATTGGRVQSYFASVQREFRPRMLVDVAYVGNKGDNLLLIANFNQATPNNAAAPFPCRRGGRFRSSATSPTSSTAASRA